MVKRQKKNNAKTRINQGKSGSPGKASKIGPSTPYGYCSERMSSFGRLLELVKFIDLVGFKEVFEGIYKPPSREPVL